MDQAEQQELSLEALKAENARLHAEVTLLRAQAGQHLSDTVLTATRHQSELASSRAETTDAQQRQAVADQATLDAEKRHRGEMRVSAGELAASKRLVAELRASETARLEAERRQQVLNQELSHRLKNTLTMVQAIAAQTLRSVSEQEAVAAFRQRVTALSLAHDVLLQQSWAAAPLDVVAQQVLSLHTDLSRFAFAGPKVKLGPKAVLSFSLLMHELATNAVKYGSLSMEGGTVELGWSVEPTPEGEQLVLTWVESGGPSVSEPKRSGFGSRLIRTGLSGTDKTILRYNQTGLRAEFRSSLGLVTEQ